MNKKKYLQNPILCNEIIYEDNNLKLTKKWTWNVESVYENEEAYVCKALLYGEYSNGGGKSTFVSYDGERLIDLDFDYIGDYEDGMWLVGIQGQGYGFLNKDIKIAVPIKYQNANDFANGYASVNDGERWLFVDKKGNEIHLENKYQRLGHFSEGLALVSTLRIGWNDLAYQSDYGDNAGTWGYVNEKGVEVIKPQYIYAFDFCNDRAIVAKGRWTIDKKWDNECNQGRYWTEEEQWGVIDKNGNEIIPCIYDEIRTFMNDDFSICEDYYQVHIGGWKHGKWAVLDRNGNFITKPIFEDYSYDYCNGMITFKEENTYEDIPLGIYDINENKILSEPQFDDVSFLDDGNLLVEIFDKNLGHKIEKIIDLNGNELFKSDYTSIYTYKSPYIAIKEANGLTIFNKIESNGQILNSFKTEDKVSYWESAINFETRTYIYSEGNKRGLKNFDGEIIIPANYEYFKMCHHNNNFYYFKLKKDGNDAGLMKSDGTIIIPPKYKNITLLSNKKIICNGKNLVDVFEYE